jgi:hypothetical protein
MLNPFFLQGSKSEQGLIQDLINEQLRMYGVEVHYLPRKYITEKTIMREVIESHLILHIQLKHMLKTLMDMVIIPQFYQSLVFKHLMS